MRKQFLLLVLIFIAGIGNAQDELGKHSVSLNLGGTSVYAGASYEFFIKNHFQLDAGIGYPGFGLGMNYYPWMRKSGVVRPYIGISARMISNYLDYFHPFFVAPVGITWFMKKKLNVALALEPGLIQTSAKSDPGKEIFVPFVWANVKVTYRLGK